MKYLFTISLYLITSPLWATQYITGSDTKVFTYKDLHSKTLGHLGKNSTVEATAIDKEWYKIHYNGADGFVQKKYLQEKAAPLIEDDADDSNTIYIFGGCVLALIAIVAGALYRYAPKKKKRKQNLVITPQMVVHWYQCRHCSIYIQKNTEASITGCEKAHAHHWIKLGQVGDHKYICKKCSTIINVVSEPSEDGCRDGGQHQWKKV